MALTIAIQTYNRAETLAKTLESLRSLRCPPGIDYEILVVENNCSDSTPEVIEHFRAILAPRLRSVSEPKQGLSHARNRALHEARGEIVCFLDDDVIVDSGWLAAVHGAFEKYSAAVVGGKSYLIYPSQRPSWLAERYEVFLSRLDYGDEAIVDTDRDLYGLNFSVRRDLAIQVGGFDISMGRCGRSLRSGEESDLLARVRADGGVAVYEPGAVVGHVIPPERLRIRWFAGRVFYGNVGSERWLISRGRHPQVLKAAIRTIRCLGSIPKSFAHGDFSKRTLFDKTMSLVGALGVLVVNMRWSVHRCPRRHDGIHAPDV